MVPLNLVTGMLTSFVSSILPFVKKHFVPIAIVGLLLFTHWYAYDAGKEKVEAQYAEQRKELIEENARLNKMWLAQSQKLADKQVEDMIKVERENTKRAEEIAQYVRDNPKDPSCDLTESDVEFLRDSVR